MTVSDRAAEINEILDTFKEKGISHDPKRGLDKVLRFQDLIGQASESELSEIEAAMNSTVRSTFVWACFSTLDCDGALAVFKVTTAQRKMREWVEQEEVEINKRHNDLFDKEHALKAERIEFEAEKERLRGKVLDQGEKIKNHLVSIKRACDDAEYLRGVCDGKDTQINTLKTKLAQYDGLKAIIRDAISEKVK